MLKFAQVQFLMLLNIPQYLLFDWVGMYVGTYVQCSEVRFGGKWRLLSHIIQRPTKSDFAQIF
jgi:hypothetical protein